MNDQESALLQSLHNDDTGAHGPDPILKQRQSPPGTPVIEITHVEDSPKPMLLTSSSTNDPKQFLSAYDRLHDKSSTPSLHTLDSGLSTVRGDVTLGRPARRRTAKLLDILAVATSLSCLIMGVVVVHPKLAVSWYLGFQWQIIVVGFLIGVMNLCADMIVPSCLVAIEARYGKSRLQNFEALLMNKFLATHIAFHWRVAIVLFLTLPLALSVGYKQFLGGIGTAEIDAVTIKALDGHYGVAFPKIGDWKPINDPIYLQMASNAAFNTASAEDNVAPNVTEQRPIPYGFNVLLLSNDSAAILDLPTNNYLSKMRAQYKDGESWQVSTTVDAYVVTRNETMAAQFRQNDSYWQETLNDSALGLVSYWLAQDVQTKIGMLPVVNQSFCWIAVYKGGPSTDSMYSKSLNDTDAAYFRTTAELFGLRRQQCQATWEINASSMRLLSGLCERGSAVHVSANQESVQGPSSGPFAVSGSPSLPHIFWKFVVRRPDSPWLMPTYAVTVATSYWARALYMIEMNGYQGYEYGVRNQQILSTRQTLDAAPMLFLCLTVQPLLTILAFVTKSVLSLPISGNFGLVSVLAGVKKSSLQMLGGAAFSGNLTRPIKMQISFAEHEDRTSYDEPATAISYELKLERVIDKYVVPKADHKTLYM